MVEKKVDISRGNPEFPLTSDELGEKFTDCAQMALDRETVRDAMNALRNIDRIRNVAEFTALLAGSPAAISSRA
jgi:hypothetical protein